MTPYQRLHVELRRQRDVNGLPFESAWPIGLGAAVRGLPPSTATWWRFVFAEQRHVWKANYRGPNLRRPLTLPDPEHRPAERQTVIA